MVVAEAVVLVAYDEAWPSRFIEERERIGRALGSMAVGIEHVGSTAVADLAAKPIIDVMVGVRDLRDWDRCVRPLEGLSYECRGEAGVPGRLFFGKGAPRRTHHLHLTEFGGEFWERHLLFRDHLRAHPEVAEAYARLKCALAERFGDDRAAYTEAKTEFVCGVLQRARQSPGG